MRWYDAGNGMAVGLCGAVYAAGLFVFAFVAAGGGHGTYLPFAIFGAPLSLLHARIAMFAVLIVWPVGGVILGASRRLVWPVTFLSVHTLAVGAILLWGSRFESASEQWQYLEDARRHVGGAIASGITLYLIGQAACWTLLLLRKRDDQFGRAG
jgi:hypothetical protein